MSPARRGGAAVLVTLAMLGVGGPVGCRLPQRTAPAPPGRAAPLPLPRPVRAVWVARFHYRDADDVRAIIRNCAAMGCNTVLWQVRGAGTVTYPSRLEPWTEEFGFADPGYDPLALAVAEAHRHGLRIEAWFNVLPGWQGPRPPPLANQLWNARPGWFLCDAGGQRQPLAILDAKTGKPANHYLLLNPCLPEVRQHIAALIDEIVSRYDVDGVHLDYVRYAWETIPDAEKKYPRDARTLELYYRETRKRPDDDPAAWKHWRAAQLTRLVADVRRVLDRRRPGAALTAAVSSNPRTAYDAYLQNGVAWLRSGLVDALMPMAYTEKPAEFAAAVEAYRHLVGGRRIVPGVGVYKHKAAHVMEQQLEYCRAAGGDFALFSYDSFYPNSQDRSDPNGPRAEAQAERQLRRAVLKRFAGS